MKNTLAALIVLNTLCIGLAGLRLVTHQAWFEAGLVLVAMIANLIIADKLNLSQIN